MSEKSAQVLGSHEFLFGQYTLVLIGKESSKTKATLDCITKRKMMHQVVSVRQKWSGGCALEDDCC